MNRLLLPAVTLAFGILTLTAQEIVPPRPVQVPRPVQFQNPINTAPDTKDLLPFNAQLLIKLKAADAPPMELSLVTAGKRLTMNSTEARFLLSGDLAVIEEANALVLTYELQWVLPKDLASGQGNPTTASSKVRLTFGEEVALFRSGAQQVTLSLQRVNGK